MKDEALRTSDGRIAEISLGMLNKLDPSLLRGVCSSSDELPGV